MARILTFEISSTRGLTSPVIGWKPSERRLEIPFTCLPPTTWVTSMLTVAPMFDVGGNLDSHVSKATRTDTVNTENRCDTRIAPNVVAASSL